MRTVHDCAREGDLAGLQNFLQEEPSLINAKDSSLLQTPLHVAARFNRTNIIKFLLNDWKGLEKVELESKDRFGETPLHLAAKNCYSESVLELLSHGAFLEAKTKNGMTPLHLAICYNVAELMLKDCATVDYATVSLLLEYNADCDVKDDDGDNALDLSKNPRAEKLQKLLNEHVEKQRRRLSEAKAKIAEFEADLHNIVGLQELKMQLLRWAKGMIVDDMRRALGVNIDPRKPPHMAFLGNPGTGKTMVARALGSHFYRMRILPTDKITEVQRTDLVGEFVGHTGPKTRRKIQDAEGGILFVDEAYRLIPMQKSDDKDYGIEALEEIMSVMDSGKVVVIFAGYREPMKRLITANEGFCRRVTKFFYFDDYSTAELAQILHFKMKNQNPRSPLSPFKLDESCSVEAVADLIERGTTEKQRKEMNGGLIDALLVNAREDMDMRLYESDCMDKDVLLTITMEDLNTGLGRLSQSEWL